MDSNKIIEMFGEIAAKIESEKDYITELDSILGDGDHWVNINKGYQKIMSMTDELRGLPLSKLFMNVGMSIMSTVGGSSGVLYGDAFIKASKVLKDQDSISFELGYEFLNEALNAMMNRGKAQAGDKTMIDPLATAVSAYNTCLNSNVSRVERAEIISQAAYDGMLATKSMEARKGRATYREDKGVGYIDAGAATMYYQLEIMCKYLNN